MYRDLCEWLRYIYTEISIIYSGKIYEYIKKMVGGYMGNGREIHKGYYHTGIYSIYVNGRDIYTLR